LDEIKGRRAPDATTCGPVAFVIDIAIVIVIAFDRPRSRPA
jgi:hypothetical protein